MFELVFSLIAICSVLGVLVIVWPRKRKQVDEHATARFI